MLEKLKEDMIQAMKNKDKERLITIRQIKAAVDKEHIDKHKEITDELIIDVVSHQVKLLNDSIKEFEKGKRDDLLNKALNELEILKEYLPDALTEDEVDKILEEIFEKTQPQSMRDMGTVMNEVVPLVKGRFDMSIISKKIKDKLS